MLCMEFISSHYLEEKERPKEKGIHHLSVAHQGFCIPITNVFTTHNAVQINLNLLPFNTH